MEIHPSILAWEIPWTEEPGRLQFMGSQRVRHNRNGFSASTIQMTFCMVYLVLDLKKNFFRFILLFIVESAAASKFVKAPKPIQSRVKTQKSIKWVGCRGYYRFSQTSVAFHFLDYKNNGYAWQTVFKMQVNIKKKINITHNSTTHR